MRKTVTTYLLYAALCACACKDLSAQGISTLTDIRSRFDKPQSIVWLDTFNGTWQTFHPMLIVLGFDGSQYHGMMQIESGNVRFDLQGYVKDGKAMLQEIDGNGRTSGYIIAEITDGRLYGKWWSVDFTRSADLSLRNEAVVELRKFAPEIMVFDGIVNHQSIHLAVQREESDLLSGFCAMSHDKVFYRLTGRCEDSTCDKMTFDMKSPGGRVLKIQGLLQRNTALRIDITDSDGHTLQGNASLIAKYPMQRLHYANYIGNVDCMFPVLSLPAFDTWMTMQIEDWYLAMLEHLDSLQIQHDTPGPDQRWNVQASAWVDFTLLTQDKISGIITMYDPHQSKYNRQSFIFDTRSGKTEMIRDLGRKAQFEDDLRKDALAIREFDSEDAGYLSWMKAQEYRHIALAAYGFVLFTDFDPLYGDTWTKLGYKDYTEALKRNAYVLYLMNK